MKKDVISRGPSTGAPPPPLQGINLVPSVTLQQQLSPFPCTKHPPRPPLQGLTVAGERRVAASIYGTQLVQKKPGTNCSSHHQILVSICQFVKQYFLTKTKTKSRLLHWNKIVAASKNIPLCQNSQTGPRFRNEWYRVFFSTVPPLKGPNTI